MINVFIDANIWLSLYDFSNDDLDQFHKLSDLIDTDVALILPNQVRDEVYRNRENKIKDVLSAFSKSQTQIPNICKGYDEYAEFRDKTRNLKSLHTNLLQRIRNDTIDGTLHADKVINDIFCKTIFLKCTPEIIFEAKMRFDKGNPPGKDRKYGDAINWVSLLNYVPIGEDLFFVSSDKDYRSVIDDASFCSFLHKEWVDSKKSELFFYKTLTDFINKHIETIELKSENEKDFIINQLAESGSFQNTHSIISRLEKYSSWTPDQITELCRIAIDNNQVDWILGDSDVRTFYTTLLAGFKNDKYDDAIDKIIEKLSEMEENEADLFAIFPFE
jgi:hypothetical protein